MGADHRWIKFWPQDHQRDAALQTCSFAARGLWMELICLMHEGSPYGHLTISDRPPTVKQLSQLTRGTEKEVARLMQELKSAGVYGQTDAGVIFSRRMVRDRAAAIAGHEHGMKGGNPSLNRTGKAGGLTPPVNGRGYPPPRTLDTEADTEAESEADNSRPPEYLPESRKPAKQHGDADASRPWRSSDGLISSILKRPLDREDHRTISRLVRQGSSFKDITDTLQALIEQGRGEDVRQKPLRYWDELIEQRRDLRTVPETRRH